MGPANSDSTQSGQWLCGKRPDVAMERYLLQREIEFVIPFLGHTIRPRRLLDVCCGSGHVGRQLYMVGLQVVGLDIEPTALALFRQLSSSVPLVQGDALRLPIADSGFDCVVAIHCFDHLDRIQFLQECHRVLCTGGLLIFESLNRHSYKWVLKKFHRSLTANPSGDRGDLWIDILSCTEVLRAIGNCGFEVRAIRGYSWVPFTQGSDGVLVDMAAEMEHALRLSHFYRISPRVLIAARKK